MQATGSGSSSFAGRMPQTISGMSTRSTGQAVLKLITKSAAGKKTVDFPLTLTVAFHNNPAGNMHQTHGVVGLIHLLPALAATTNKSFLQIIFPHPESQHALSQFLTLLRRNRHAEKQFTGL